MIGSTTLLREFWNGAWFILCFVMLIMIGAFVVRRFFNSSWQIRHGWYDELGTQTAIALFVFILGSALRALWIWLLLNCQNGGGDCTWIVNQSWLMDIAGIVAIIGGLCTIRIMSPRDWLPWSWLGAGLVAVVVPVIYYGRYEYLLTLIEQWIWRTLG